MKEVFFMSLYRIYHPATQRVVNLYTSTTGQVTQGTPLSLYLGKTTLIRDSKWNIAALLPFSVLNVLEIWSSIEMPKQMPQWFGRLIPLMPL